MHPGIHGVVVASSVATLIACAGDVSRVDPAAVARVAAAACAASSSAYAELVIGQLVLLSMIRDNVVIVCVASRHLLRPAARQTSALLLPLMHAALFAQSGELLRRSLVEDAAEAERLTSSYTSQSVLDDADATAARRVSCSDRFHSWLDDAVADPAAVADAWLAPLRAHPHVKGIAVCLRDSHVIWRDGSGLPTDASLRTEASIRAAVTGSASDTDITQVGHGLVVAAVCLSPEPRSDLVLLLALPAYCYSEDATLRISLNACIRQCFADVTAAVSSSVHSVPRVARLASPPPAPPAALPPLQSRQHAAAVDSPLPAVVADSPLPAVVADSPLPAGDTPMPPALPDSPSDPPVSSPVGIGDGSGGGDDDDGDDGDDGGDDGSGGGDDDHHGTFDDVASPVVSRLVEQAITGALSSQLFAAALEAAAAESDDDDVGGAAPIVPSANDEPHRVPAVDAGDEARSGDQPVYQPRTTVSAAAGQDDELAAGDQPIFQPRSVPARSGRASTSVAAASRLHRRAASEQQRVFGPSFGTKTSALPPALVPTPLVGASPAARAAARFDGSPITPTPPKHPPQRPPRSKSPGVTRPGFRLVRATSPPS